LENERSRRWQLTENNPDYTKEQGAERMASIGETLYVVSCCEIGESGTKHIHIFVIYKNAISLVSIKRLFPRAHLEKCQGSNVENREYIIKDDSDFYESGSMPIASASTRKKDEASEVVRLLYEGKTLFDIMSDYSDLTDYIVRNFRNLKEIEHELGRHTTRRKGR